MMDYQMNQYIIAWIQDFLCERTWAVRINGVLSTWRGTPSGVPQGSVLGPVLFILFVNELPGIIRSPCLFFADDLKCWREITQVYDETILQKDINTIASWSVENKLPINLDKVFSLRIGRDSSPPIYTIHSTVIPTKSSARDLGVIVRSDLKTHDHTIHIRLRALRMLWALRRSFRTWNKAIARKLFITFVRPIMEYAATATHPCSLGEIESLERIQRLATRMIPELKHNCYEDRCKALNLFSLAYRRVRGDMILTYKILRLGEHSELRHLLELSNTTYTRGHTCKLAVRNTEGLSHVYRFSHRMTRTWNALPESVIETKTITEFKSRIDDFLWTNRDVLIEQLKHLPGYPAGW
jgi:hypothetical protein